MNRKTSLAPVAVSLLILAMFVILAIFYINSYQLAIRQSGLNPHSTALLNVGFDNNGVEYRIISAFNEKMEPRLARLTRGNLGFWSVHNIINDIDPKYGIITMEWMNSRGIRYFSVDDDIIFESEYHEIIQGNNAIRKIYINHDQLPRNTTINIRQAGALFILHFTAIGDSESVVNVSNEFSARDFLVENEFIKVATNP